MPQIIFRDQPLVYTHEGSGDALVLLHGFTESKSMWKHFAVQLSRHFTVVTIDLPGFGESACIEEVHSMSLMAEGVKTILDHLNIKRCVMTGHSMGGYVAFSFARKYPRMLQGLVVFHSHPFEDTPEGKVNRKRALEVIRNNKFGYLSQFIPSLFPDTVREKYQTEIQEMVEEASSLSREAILAAMTGMLEREDETETLRNATYPVLFIIGLLDSRFPHDQTMKMLQLPRQAEALILREVGHMGFIEAREETLQVIRDFGRRCCC